MIMTGVTATETREAPPSHLHLKIESFSSIEERGLEKLESEDFTVGNYNWRLVIYPNGHGTEEAVEDYVSVYLTLSGTDYLPENWEVNAVFSIFIFNQISGTYLYTPGMNRRFFRLNSSWGYPEFISKKSFSTPSNGYLVNDNCVFGAEVFVLENKAVTQCLSLKNVGNVSDDNVPHSNVSNDNVPHSNVSNVNVPHSRVFEISNFSKLKSVWSSEEFTVGGYEWKVEVFPNGNFFHIGRSLSVYLMCASLAKIPPMKRVNTSFSVCMKNQIDSSRNWKLINYGCCFPPLSKHFRNGFECFIFLDSFKNPNGGFLVNDRCQMEIELFVQD